MLYPKRWHHGLGGEGEGELDTRDPFQESDNERPKKYVIDFLQHIYHNSAGSECPSNC